MTVTGHNSAVLLKDLIERINDQLDEKARIMDEVKDIYAQAKESGIDVQGLREHIRQMREDEEKRRAKEKAVELIRLQLQGLAETDLGRAAIENVMRAG